MGFSFSEADSLLIHPWHYRMHDSVKLQTVYLGRLCLLKALYFVVLLTFACLPMLTCHFSFFLLLLSSLSHPVKLLLVQNLVECYWLLATCYILHDPSGKLGFSGWLIIFSIQNGELFTQSYTATEWVNSGTSLWRAINSMQLSTVSELTRIRIMTGKIYKLRHWTMLWQRYWYSGVR